MGPGFWGGMDMPCFPQPSISSVVTAPFPDDSQVLSPSASLPTVIYLLSHSVSSFVSPTTQSPPCQDSPDLMPAPTPFSLSLLLPAPSDPFSHSS